MTRLPHRQSLAGLALILAIGCRSTPPAERLERLYLDGLEERGQLDAEDMLAIEAGRTARIEEVKEILASDFAMDTLDQLHAAAILIDSREPEDLALARDLALDAAERGDEAGFALAAEAIDRERLSLGLPQKYGTQYVYSPVTDQWLLYQWEPTTTDVERRAMGVATLGEALARVAELNRPADDH